VRSGFAMSARLAVALVGAAAGLLAVSLFVPTVMAQDLRSAAIANDLELVETEVVGLERRITQLRAEVSSGALTRSPRLTSERFNEARYAYLVEDYERCALIFYSLLENDDLAGDSRKEQAQWYLGECLYLDGNLVPAQNQFRSIVDEGSNHAFYGESLLSLIELYGRTGEVHEFNYYYNNFVRSSWENSATALRIRYQMGKTLYQQGKLGEAEGIFNSFPRGSTYTPQARYFYGAILVAEGLKASQEGEEAIATQKYQQAISVFRDVLTFPVSTSAHEEVVDLAHLAIGRLYYELGDIPRAITEYREISADSSSYDDALYEMIWANIEAAAQEEQPYARERKHLEALRATEIFNLAFPDDTREPKLRLLGAQVRQKMEQWDQAIEGFENASVHFSELTVALQGIVRSSSDPMVYFNQLVDDERYVAEAAQTVPAAARRKAKDDERVAEAVRISGDLYKQQDAIQESKDLLDLLNDALYGSEAIGLIQTYRLHRQQLASAEAAGLLLRSRLVDLEVLHLEGLVTGSSLKDLNAIRNQRQEAEGAASGLTRMRNSSVERQGAFNLQAEAVETRMYHAELMINDLLGRLMGVEEYLLGARKRGERTREEEVALRAEIDKERGVLTSMRDDLRKKKRRLEPRILTARLANQATEGEGEMRGDARESLTALEQRLGRLRRSVSGSGGDFLQRLDSARSRLLSLDRVASDARKLMDRAESVEIDEIKAEVDFQRRMVDSLDTDSQQIAGANTGVSGRIGRQAFVNVATFYEDMLTRADMGVIDVYWYRKESTSLAKKETARERTRRLRGLRGSFESVLGDSQ